MTEPLLPSASRRDFLRAGAGAAALAALAPRSLAAEPDTTADVIRELIRFNDERIPELLASQERRAVHRWIGGQMNDYGLHSATGTKALVVAYTCALCSEGGKYRGSAEVTEALRLAADYLNRVQYEDGTVDFYATNFRSPPDVAFIVENLGPCYSVLKASSDPKLGAIADALGRFIVKAADGLAVGGVHTPNHRWVVCCALAIANSLFPNPRYVARIDQWLAENIDLDPDGQYTEKSTTVYSPIVDRALVVVARLLKRPELLEPVRRNLEMTLYYVHPDGEVVTEASRRQDRYQRGSMARYYYAYRHLAIIDGNGRVAPMTRQIEGGAPAQIARAAQELLKARRFEAARTLLEASLELISFLSEPEFRRPLPASAPLPKDYSRLFSYSSLARVRRGDRSGTILAGNTTLFSYRHRSAALEAVRFATAFFGKGQFTGDTIEAREGGYVVRQSLEGPYFQPLTKEQIADGEHTKMAPNGTLANSGRALRARSNISKLEASVNVTEKDGRFRLEFLIEGTSEVPVAIELAFRQGGNLHGVDPLPGVTDAYLLRSGKGRYESGGDVIEFGPGRVEHTYTQVRGASPKWDGLSVYLTGMTPFRATLDIG
ncbi:MAG: hypothetical protein ACKOTF_09020 [Opitutaceae bacterium]